MSTIDGRMKVRPRLPILGVLLAGCVLAPAGVAAAQCVNPLRDGSFEGQRTRFVSTPWVPEGRAGIDIRRGLSARGANNAWARNTTGWNGIRQAVRLNAGVLYTLKARVRTSANVRDGYFGFRNPLQRPVSEIRFGNLRTYRELRVRLRPARTRTYHVFAGFWAPGRDSWIQVDDVRLLAPCEDVVLNPVDD
jgi:hypothetical protein